ncbi:MAG: DUF190 domain-containing protein [Solirubrobacterales bacterium]|nr:DUF190 domain-containing protein [Solirubrobacterales bacterium]
MLNTGRPASEALMACLADHGIVSATLLRGIEGFGANRRIHAQRFPDVSTDLPLLAVAVDDRKRIERALPDVDVAVPRGLVTLEHARLATGADVVRSTFPEGPGRAVKLTVYCSEREHSHRRPAYREVVALLKRSGATGAVVLAGVDGLLYGTGRRARLFARNGNAPMVIISVGPREPLLASLPALPDLLQEPVITLEGIAQVKHDGELLEPLPTLGRSPETADDVWQTIRIYTRRIAQVDGRPLYTELTRRLREYGGAGATTILGEWGFSSDEVPYGDKFGHVGSHRPTYTVYIDRPNRVADLWPLIDEATADHGIVTSLFVPGYRERAGHIENGRLDVAHRVVAAASAESIKEDWLGTATGVLESASPWLTELRDRILNFSRARGVHQPVVRVTLADGERFFLYALEPGPGENFVTLHPHPERYAELVPTDQGRVPPRALIVPRDAIVKMELLVKPPRGTRSLVSLDMASLAPDRHRSHDP